MGQIKINAPLTFKSECHFRIRRFLNVNKFKSNILNSKGVKIKQNLYETNIVYHIAA